VRKTTLPLFGCLLSSVLALPATAQQVDNTLTMPDAQPGECFTKVITPPEFEITTEEVVIQEASERIETIEARYQTATKTVAVKDAVEELTISEAVFDTKTEQVLVRAAEDRWTSTVGDQSFPTGPDALEQIARSGVDLESVATGSCFTEYYIEAQYETQITQVLVREAGESITIVPAVFETVTEDIEVKAATTQVVDVPAVYRAETESVLVEPSRNVWQSCGLVERSDSTAGEVMCLVNVPERFETLTKTVLDTPATTKTVTIPAVTKTIEVQRLVEPAKEMREELPAEYKTVSKRVKTADATFFWLAKDAAVESNARATGRVVCYDQQPAEFATVEKQVLVEPASTVSVAVPEVFESIEVQELVAPANERRIEIPARTRMVTSRVQTAPAVLEWRQVLCEVDMTPKAISSIQNELNREGYNPGPIDGILGRQTMNAMEQFQTQNDLGIGGITYEALELLGLDLASLEVSEASQ